MTNSCGPLHMDEQRHDDQLYADTGCSPEDLPEAMDDRAGWRERVRDIRVGDIYSIILIGKKDRWYNLRIKNITQTDIWVKKSIKEKKKNQRSKNYLKIINNVVWFKPSLIRIIPLSEIERDSFWLCSLYIYIYIIL